MLKRWAGPRKLQVEAKTPLRKMPDHAFDRVEKKMGIRIRHIGPEELWQSRQSDLSDKQRKDGNEASPAYRCFRVVILPPP
jgi:hypothetical protein